MIENAGSTLLDLRRRDESFSSLASGGQVCCSQAAEGVSVGDEVVTLARKNRQLKQLTKALASRITVLEKRLSGLGWSVG
jgi:hypothetical protein